MADFYRCAIEKMAALYRNYTPMKKYGDFQQLCYLTRGFHPVKRHLFERMGYPQCLLFWEQTLRLSNGLRGTGFSGKPTYLLNRFYKISIDCLQARGFVFNQSCLVNLSIYIYIFKWNSIKGIYVGFNHSYTS